MGADTSGPRDDDRTTRSPTPAQAEFFNATNAAAVEGVIAAIESQVERLLPEGVSRSARSRVVGEIYRELDNTLRANRQLSQHMRDAFRSGALDAEHQRAIVSLVTARARQALPGVAKLAALRMTAHYSLITSHCFRRHPCPSSPRPRTRRPKTRSTWRARWWNDSAGVVFTDALLMPLLNSAYRGLQRELAESGVSVLAEQQDIDLELVTGTGVTPTEISDVSSPQLPTDCLVPHMLWERATANTTDVFVPMEKFTSGGSMLNLQPSTYLRLWEWREDKVNLIGATQAITVRMRYEKILPLLTLGTDPVQIRSATDVLGFATAALAARSRGARWRRIFSAPRKWPRRKSSSATSARNR